MKLCFPLNTVARCLRTSFLLPLIVFSIFSSVSGQAIGAQISGSVFLPNGQVAPADGVSVRISFKDSRRVTPGYGEGYAIVDIPEGVSSASFTLETPDIIVASWHIKYTMMNNSEKYYWFGYYASAGTISNRDLATPLPGGQDHSNIDITLIKAIKISGFIPSQNLNYIIGRSLFSIRCAVIGSSSHIPDEPYINFVGSVSVYNTPTTYTIIVPDIANISFLIAYSYEGDSYISTGYYSSTGTTWNSDEATLLEGGRDHTGIDISLIPGKTIRGDVSGKPVNDIGEWEVEISVVDVNGLAFGDSTKVSSGRYILNVPDVAGAFWRVNYQFSCSYYRNYRFDDCQFGVVETGYYASTGTTWNQAEATFLGGGEDHSGINLTYLPGNNITGLISIPSNYVGQFGDQISIYAEDKNYKAPTAYIRRRNINIYDYPPSISYNLNVPNTTKASWRVKVHSPSSPFVKNLYYGGNITTWNMYKASALTGGQDHSGIDLTFILVKPVYEAPFLPGILKLLLLTAQTQ